MGDAEVAKVARAVLGPDAAVAASELRPLDYTIVNAASGGLYRLSGTARVDGAEAPFSAILKIAIDPQGRSLIPGGAVHVGGGAEDLRHHNYYRREYEAYRSGLLSAVPGVGTPKLLHAEMKDPSTAWLWLEELAGEPGVLWPFERFAEAARHLAHMNAAWSERPPARTPWMTDGFLRSWTATYDLNGVVAYVSTTEAWNAPLIRAHFPSNLRARIVGAWARLPDRLAALERLFATTCHHDAHAGNLFSRQRNGCDETVAIDWAFVGEGAFGEDLAPLVFSSVAQSVRGGGTLSESDRPRLTEAVFEGYMAGLADAGLEVGRRAVETAFVTHAGYRYLLAFVNAALRAQDNPAGRPMVEWMNAAPFEDALDVIAMRVEWALGLLDGLGD